MQLFRKYTALLSLGLITYSANAQDILYAQPGSNLTIQANADLYVEGNITLASGSFINNQGRLYVNRNTINGVANWLDQSTGSYSYGPGSVIFNSSGYQTVASPNRFGTIEVRNSGLNLGSTIQSQNWLLHSGIIHTGSFLAVTLSNAELAVNATAANPNFSNSWFNGTLRRYIQPATVNNYMFPVGNAMRVNKAELFDLTASPINAIYVDATFIPKPGTDAGLFLPSDGLLYTAVNSGGVWNIQPDVAALTGQYKLRLFFNGFTSLIDNMFGILQRPVSSSNGADWIVPVGSNIPSVNQPGRLSTDGFARRNTISVMGQFGIGLSSTVPLPFTLLDFTAKRMNEQQVSLTWKIASDENNATFTIERKLSNEESFRIVKTITTTFNGLEKWDYHFQDNNTDNGKSWYRLKMISQTGIITYSSIRTVNGNTNSLSPITIAPNPNRGTFSIIAKGGKDVNQASIYDAKGRLIKTFIIEKSTPVQITGLSAGIYFLTIPDYFEKGAAFKEKIVVLHK